MRNKPSVKKAVNISMAEANRLGATKNLSLEPRQAPNLNETTATIIWRQKDNSSIIYDPWCSNERAQVMHGHYHTSWARNIHFSWMGGFFNELLRKFDDFKTLDEAKKWIEDKAKAYLIGNKDLFTKPATFDWKDKVVYIVGRGESSKKNVEVLNSVKRKNPAIFISSAYTVTPPQPDDFIFIADNRILALGHASYNGAINNPLISFPGIDQSIVRDKWNGVYGFVPWTRSPVNDFMREIFPHLPPTLDILSSAVMATHLACLNNAKAVVFIGMDHTVKGAKPDMIKTKDIHGNKCKTIQGYFEMQTAICQFAGFARFHCKTRFINATGAGILGVNYFSEPEKEKLFPWIEQTNVEKVLEEFE